jgi:glycosyltransferase involved in cell wall biosynthesis
MDSSGYAKFARMWAVAMHEAGWDIGLEQISFEQSHTDHGADGEICKSLISSGTKGCEINIINMIPRLYAKLKKPNAMNIGFTMFEATKIPASWVEECNGMDAILVPCQWNKEVFVSSGVTVPVEVAVPGINPARHPQPRPSVPDAKDFKFYSIFQWSERKNPSALIRAFTSAFAGESNVSLTLKTYLRSFSKEELNALRNEIVAIRDSVEVKNPPQIILKHEKMSDEQMMRLHASHDCFVLPSRAEGLGLPYIESMMAGNPTIGTRYSGNLEFMNDENSFLIDYQLEPVFNMKHMREWYTGDMRWAQANVAQLADTMRYIYENRGEARSKASVARAELCERFSWDGQLAKLNDVLVKLYNSYGRKQ